MTGRLTKRQLQWTLDDYFKLALPIVLTLVVAGARQEIVYWSRLSISSLSGVPGWKSLERFKPTEQMAQALQKASGKTLQVVVPGKGDIRVVKQLQDLFAGGPHSVVARAVGSAEGTRTPDGGVTSAYAGHWDPGNGRWNQGSFSYQYPAQSPEEADQLQLKRLLRQTIIMMRQAQRLNIAPLSLEELLNAIDLANQSPAAALTAGGYMERLAEAKHSGKQGEAAIVWARTQSFLDPTTGIWNAPGLGNTVQSITQDQQRRYDAILSAMNYVQ